MPIYVSKESRGGEGTKKYPLNSIAQAAQIAGPGDEVKPTTVLRMIDNI